MINQILAITIKELKVLSRNRGAIVGLFLLPIVFILVMTTALQGVFDTGSRKNPVPLLVINLDTGAIASKVISDLHSVDGLTIITDLNSQILTRASAEELITAHKYSLALVFPANFSAQVQAAALDDSAQPALVSFVVDPTVGNQLLSPAKGMVQGYIEREASIAQAPQRAMKGFSQVAANLPSSQTAVLQAAGNQFASQMAKGSSSTLENPGVAYQVVSPAKYQETRYPTSAEQNVPGYTIYGVFFIITTIASGIFRERNEGTFRRLQAAPLSKTTYLIGKMLPYYLINLIQIALMFTIGVVVFHIGLGHDPLALILISLATSTAATGLGLLVASLGKNEEQVGSLGTMLSITLATLAAVGGMMVPMSVMPKFMQSVVLFTPHAWASSGFQDLMVRGLGLSAILPAFGMLMAFALVFWTVAVWRFQYDE